MKRDVRQLDYIVLNISKYEVKIFVCKIYKYNIP